MATGRGERLTGCVAIVTGTGTSRGRAAAVALAREGSSVIAVDTDADAAGATAAEVRSLAAQPGIATETGGATDAHRPRVAAFVGDPDDPEDAEALVEMVAELFPER